MTVVSRVVWGAVLALSLAPWPLRRARAQLEVITESQRESAQQAEQDSTNAALAESFQRLTPESPLREWLVVAAATPELRERVLAGARTLPGRQAQAESMRGDDQAMLMSELRNLGLAATPELCDTANDFLAAHAESFRDRAATTSRYEIEGASIERYLFATHWLASNGCNVSRAIDVTESVVRLFPADPAREQFLARLASLRPVRP
jgi:hypothetical protein